MNRKDPSGAAGLIVRTLCACAVYAGAAVLFATDGGADTQPSRDAAFVTHPAYPLKAGATNRYLVDQNNVPFLMVGDAPQTMVGRLSLAEATAYMANRGRY